MNIVLITSLCYTPKVPFNYSNVRSVFTPQERYRQLLKTISSVKETFPGYHIMLVDCSPFSQEEEKYLNSECDTIINLVNDEEARQDIFSCYKGLGERIMTVRALEYITKHFKVQKLFKISGRYYYNEKLNLSEFDNDKINFYCIQGDKHNVNTCGYKIPGKYINKYLQYLSTTRDDVVRLYNGGYERYIASFVNKNIDNVSFLSNLGISGQVSVCGSQFSK